MILSWAAGFILWVLHEAVMFVLAHWQWFAIFLLFCTIIFCLILFFVIKFTCSVGLLLWMNYRQKKLTKS